MSDDIKRLGNHYFEVIEVYESRVTKQWKLDHSILKNCYDESELKATMSFEEFVVLSQNQDEEVLQSIYYHLAENDPDNENDEDINSDLTAQNRTMEVVFHTPPQMPRKKYRSRKMKSRICMKL